ncbi:hypothetical protein DER46DRAFT_618920 [Fusarium sp. MPI-SDFR-AT-0072]|nr:hypothetical protein DER46DRAFT_618920 [Fusarium sp. MPI-SDFR-AT-0072]
MFFVLLLAMMLHMTFGAKHFPGAWWSLKRLQKGPFLNRHDMLLKNTQSRQKSTAFPYPSNNDTTHPCFYDPRITAKVSVLVLKRFRAYLLLKPSQNSNPNLHSSGIGYRKSGRLNFHSIKPRSKHRKALGLMFNLDKRSMENAQNTAWSTVLIAFIGGIGR